MTSDMIGLEIHTKTKIYFNKNFTLNLQLFDQKVDMIHGFDVKTIAAKPFAPRIPDICFNVLGLPHFYKPFSKISEMFNKALPMLEICSRKGSIAFNHEKVAQAVEGEEVTFVTQEKDESELKLGTGVRIYVTPTSFSSFLFQCFVKKSFEIPDCIIFDNGNSTAPYRCPFTFAQQDIYQVPDLDNLHSKCFELGVCGSCHRIGCNMYEEKCPNKRNKQNLEIAAFVQEKKRKIEAKNVRIERAAKQKAWYKSKSKSRFS
jgi:hypothetical protein